MRKNELENLFRKYDFFPDSALDQHFLNNEDVISEIIALLEVSPNDVIFEVGAGIGTITKEIPPCKKVFAVEIEERTFEILKEETEDISYIEPVNGDALSLLDSLPFTKLISSTPFSICEPLLQKLFTKDYEKCVLLLPKKFIDTVLMKSTKLGLFADAFLRIKSVREILPDSFSPVPGARTMIVTITKRDLLTKEQALSDLSGLYRFMIISMFNQRDKKFKNALREMFVSLLSKSKKESLSFISQMDISDAVLDRNVENLNYAHYTKFLSEGEKIIGSIIKNQEATKTDSA